MENKPRMLMSQTNFDFLFQVTAPVGELSSYDAPRGGELRSDFGDHLMHASSKTPDTASTAESSGDRANRDAAVNNYEPSSADNGRDEIASSGEQADGGANDSDATASSETAESTGNDISTAVMAKTDSLSGSTVTDDEDRETDTDDAAQRDSAVFVVASTDQRAAIIPAGTKNGSSKACGDVMAKETASAAEANDAVSQSGALAKSSLAELDVANAPMEVAVETTTQSEKPSQGNQRTGEQIIAAGQESDMTTVHRGEKIESVAASIDPFLGESARAERDASSPDNRDANTQSTTRQRADGAALTGKFATAAVANGAGPPPASSASPHEANDGASRAGDGVATVAAIGSGEHGLQAHAGTSKRGNRVNGGDEMPRIDPARFVGRVAKAFHTAQERGGTLQIRLSPPELGAMRLELSVKDGVMTAFLETETTSARRALLEHLPALRERLAEQNIRVERFDVDVRREGTGGQADPRGTQDQRQPYHERSEPRRLQTQVPPIAETARQQPIHVGQASNNGINLVV